MRRESNREEAQPLKDSNADNLDNLNTKSETLDKGNTKIVSEMGRQLKKEGGAPTTKRQEAPMWRRREREK